MKIYLSSIGLCLLFTGFTLVLNAQSLNLNKGDEYKITSVMSSSSAMKRGDKLLEMESMSKLTKTYKVTEANANGYTLTMAVTNVADTINGFNQKLAYNTNRAADPASTIETALHKMLSETQTISLDKTGKVTQVSNVAKATSDAATAAIAGVYYEKPLVGMLFELSANFKLPAGFAKGTTWKDNSKFGEVTINTTYKVEQITATHTKVSFMTESMQPGANTNVNGALILENKSGIVVQKILKTDTKSNASLDGKDFSVAGKKMISEICEKVN